MPKQNRVTPEGQIIATAARGTFMGNRGILHNAQQEIVKPFAHKAWIICLLSFKGWHREVMSPGTYTELFFLDEATALGIDLALSASERQRWLSEMPGYRGIRSLILGDQ